MKKTAMLVAVLVMVFLGIAKFESRAEEPTTTPVTSSTTEIGGETSTLISGDVRIFIDDGNGGGGRITAKGSQWARQLIAFENGTNGITITATDTQGSGQATVDLNRVFRQSLEFQREREAFKQEAQQAEMLMRQNLTQLQELERQLDAAQADQVQADRIRLEMELKKVAHQASRKALQKRLLKQETTIQAKVYEKIKAEIALYAKEYGIHVVRRVSDAKSNQLSGNVVGTLTTNIEGKQENFKPNQVVNLVLTDNVLTAIKADDSKPANGLSGVGLTADNVTINVAADGKSPAAASSGVTGNGIYVNLVSNQAAQIAAQLEPDENPAKLQAMLKQEFLYVDRGEARDITEAIVKRLNDKAAKSDQKPKS